MGIYQTIFDLINTYVFGGGVVAGSYQELATIIISVLACLFVVAIPFILVWKIIKIFL